MSAERVTVPIDKTSLIKTFLHEGKSYRMKEFNIVELSAESTLRVLDNILLSCDYNPDITKVYVSKRGDPLSISSGKYYLLQVSVTAVAGNEVKSVIGITIDSKGIPAPRFGEILLPIGGLDKGLS